MFQWFVHSKSLYWANVVAEVEAYTIFKDRTFSFLACCVQAFVKQTRTNPSFWFWVSLYVNKFKHLFRHMLIDYILDKRMLATVKKQQPKKTQNWNKQTKNRCVHTRALHYHHQTNFHVFALLQLFTDNKTYWDFHQNTSINMTQASLNNASHTYT